MKSPRRPIEQLSMMDEPTDVAGHQRRIRGKTGKRPRGPRFGEQIDLFPPAVTVEPLDPRSILGKRTRVTQLWRVTIGTGEPHLVFEDRHGIYCESHGTGCRAVSAVR